MSTCHYSRTPGFSPAIYIACAESLKRLTNFCLTPPTFTVTSSTGLRAVAVGGQPRGARCSPLRWWPTRNCNQTAARKRFCSHRFNSSCRIAIHWSVTFDYIKHRRGFNPFANFSESQTRHEFHLCQQGARHQSCSCPRFCENPRDRGCPSRAIQKRQKNSVCCRPASSAIAAHKIFCHYCHDPSLRL